MTQELMDAVRVDTHAHPDCVVILMHGLGDNGWSYASLVPALDLPKSLKARFICPHAPIMPVTCNNGYAMPAWYDIFDLEDRSREDDAGLKRSQQAINALIDAEIARGIPASRIVLAGFSQGCAMTLHTGLRYPARLAGLIGLSGYLPLRARFAQERHPSNQDTPIFMAHGVSDPVVPFAAGRDSRDMLQQAGYAVEWHEYPMQHNISQQEIADVSRWLQRILG